MLGTGLYPMWLFRFFLDAKHTLLATSFMSKPGPVSRHKVWKWLPHIFNPYVHMSTMLTLFFATSILGMERNEDPTTNPPPGTPTATKYKVGDLVRVFQGTVNPHSNPNPNPHSNPNFKLTLTPTPTLIPTLTLILTLTLTLTLTIILTLNLTLILTSTLTYY